ncbi:LXG domain-containing protein [Listeria monocytogenes]|uniref:LXG domain-containing protein n=1 Tax=Listeria seeligeri TaxID=1640 RepID=UPI0022EC0DDC|nr:LXG domain-containing protein [Listeria seeligeri]EKT6042427.1 LXG domain-containing protein [Listeria monocytogenes]EKT6045438.1 LXG domain-containing protein [Listeria monocytogenes]
MSRIDIAELNEFLHGLRSSNAEAKDMMGNITQAAADYAQDDSLKGVAVTTSKQYFTETYMPIIQSIIEALNESEERLAQYIREFGAQVDPSPSAKVDAQILQEVMGKVSQLQRKEEDLHRQLTAPNTKPDMEQVYVVKSRSVHTQLLKAIENENILERYLDFEQSHGQFFSALDELIRATRRAVQELLDNVTFNDKTGTYSIPKSASSSLQLMKKALDAARKENDKDPYPESFEDYTLFAYTYVNDQGKNVTMWLIEKNGKRVENKELQDFLEKNGQDLPPISYTELSGEDLERKVNDSWKEGVNYLTGQKVTGASAGVLRTSAYIASGKDVMDDTGLTDMALGLGFGIAAARNKPVLKEKINPREKILKSIEESKKVREASKFKEYLKREKIALEKIKKRNNKKIIESNLGNEIDITPLDNHKTVESNPGPYGEPNSSLDILDKKGNIKTRRFYDNNGRAIRDVDMTNHGNAKKHPEYPHEHFWSYDSNGNKPSRNN